MKRFTIGIIGAGTVGTGVYQLLKRKHAHLQKVAGVDIRVKLVCDVDKKKLRACGIRSQCQTRRYQDVLGDGDIQCVVELIGGIHPADRIIIATANISGAALLTRDEKILKYPNVETIW